MEAGNHCIAKALVGSHPARTLIVLEDLSGIRRTVDRCKINGKYILVSWSFDDPAAEDLLQSPQRQKVIFADPAYTSRPVRNAFIPGETTGTGKSTNSAADDAAVCRTTTGSVR